MKCKGFTLVELSIVLIIIGLLIGGILVAQSLIQTVKVQGYIRKLQQYEIAIQNFKTNYKSEPGDSKYFTPIGNGNGLTVDGGMEWCAVWNHLSQAKMIKGDYSACGWMSSSPIPWSPTFAETGLWQTLGQSVDNTNNVTVWYIIRSGSPRFLNSYLIPIEAVAVDAKIDNGISDTGSFIAIEDFNTGEPCSQYLQEGVNIDSTLCNILWTPDSGTPSWN